MHVVVGIILGFLALLIAVWLLQWAVAIIVWCFQAVLLPIFIILMPAIIALVFLAGMYWGGWVSARNYFESVHKNTNPKGGMKSVIRYGVVGSQVLTLTVLCAALTLVSGVAIHALSMQGVAWVQGYYAAIEFPFFEIQFLFWKLWD